jgi:hypothetical protein
MSNHQRTPAGYRAEQMKLRRVTLAPPPTPASSAMLRSSVIEQWQPTLERFIGGALLGLSIAGTVALFSGGWGQPTLTPFVWACGVQGLLTLVEWMYRRRRWSWQYATALLIDTGLSVGGYAALAIAPLTRSLDRLLPPLAASAGAWLVLLAAAGFLAYIPERILVSD